MRAILIIFSLAMAFVANAGEVVWHKGSVVLTTKEVESGDLARQGFDLLLLKHSDGNITVYPAHRVSSFRYYDEKENINRAFIAMGNKYYERVVFGRISVFRIQKFFDQAISEEDPGAFDFYIEEHRRVSPLKSFRRKYFDRIREELDLGLISYEHLDPNTSHGAVSLIVLYNGSLKAGSI